MLFEGIFFINLLLNW